MSSSFPFRQHSNTFFLHLLLSDNKQFIAPPLVFLALSLERSAGMIAGADPGK